MDFTLFATLDLARTIEAERDHARRTSRWRRELGEIEAAEKHAMSPRFLEARRREFRRSLDAAQEAGMTVDAWMTGGGIRRAKSRAGNGFDPGLSERANWAGLNDAA